MSSEARQQYGLALAARRQGIMSEADASTPFDEVKPDFYADSKLLAGAVLGVFNDYLDRYPPYGLVNWEGEPLSEFQDWIDLEKNMTSTITAVFNETNAPIESCPYHEVIGQRLGKIPRVELDPQDQNDRGLDTLRNVSLPGGYFAPATIVNLIKRIPAMKAVSGAHESTEELARNSKFTLLSEPLNHPQQYAKPFIFCLAEGYGGTDYGFDRDTFLPDKLIESYLALGENKQGKEAMVWALPTEDFTLRAVVRVANRLRGSETEQGSHVIVYPRGTRLGDIEVNEPTIGCPGSQVAYAMWDRVVDIAAEGAWAA